VKDESTDRKKEVRAQRDNKCTNEDDDESTNEDDDEYTSEQVLSPNIGSLPLNWGILD
jgi:hypothetical protein